ncbi:flagellar assembly protein FliW [Bacillus sp. HMF5848]|uniref:flagellar assembly protein FliW n=1 Tax=Bacillus sp. HMF5848 TaxID=2495421 RepID=UPI000F78E967|nr:flagellar assembly protein FliW [Bacillus sp. HMF5848]RSK28621.1 flagellar assembly protein FliW [Bacillus sp. HMF5848]
MKLETKYHGEIVVKEKEILQFESGIPGFSDEKKFIILPFTDDNTFQILQSVNTPALAFVITSPFLFFKEYDISIENNVVGQLEIVDAKDVVLYVILTVSEKFEDTTANLQGPIVINAKNNKAKQVILTGSNYRTKHLIFPQPQGVE